MRLFIAQHLVVESRRSAARFPLSLGAAALAAGCGVAAVGADETSTLLRCLAAAQLGIPLFFALAATGESFSWSRPRRGVFSTIAAAALVAYYISLPEQFTTGTIARFVQFNVALHLFAAFGPFAGRGRVNGFWHYNKFLFVRFLTAALYSAVVFAGLSIALTAVDKLFGLHVGENTYVRLWTVVALVFNTWVFLGGVPSRITDLEGIAEYPRGIKVFAQYILIPLVVVYLVILTSYLGKIVVTTVWPSGWIGYLVSSVAVAGILALLLVWPVSARTDNRWVGTYIRWFFIFMVPSIVMLLMAIAKRIDQYGITENRYFLAVLAVWLAAISVYFIVGKHKNIKLIPVTLCVVAFATSFGPWGAYTVSRNSQMGRLEALLSKNGMFADGRVHEAKAEVSFEDRREISAILRYVVDSHGVKTLEPWFGTERLASVDTIGWGGSPFDEHGAGERVRIIAADLGIDYVERWVNPRRGYFRFALDPDASVFEVDGADYLVKLSAPAHGHQPIGGTAYSLAWDDTSHIQLRTDGEVVLEVSTGELFERFDSGGLSSVNPSRMPADVMHIVGETDGARLDVYVTLISGQTWDTERRVRHLTADCFVTIE